MYAVTGITGKVGGVVARAPLAAGLPVRAVVRDADKGQPWAEKGCEVAIASIADADSLTKAFSGVAGVFRTHEAIVAIKTAIDAARPGKAVFLSTVGAHVGEFNLLNNAKITEEGLRTVHVPVAFLRAAWFMENASHSTIPFRWSRRPMLEVRRWACSSKAGRVSALSNSKDRAAIRRTTSPRALPRRSAIL